MGESQIYFGTSRIIGLVTCLVCVVPSFAQVPDCAGALGAIFNQMRAERDRADTHPDVIEETEFGKLAPNTRVYVDARDLAFVAPIQKGQKIAPMYVIAYENNKLNLFSVALGWIVIAPGSRIRLYRRANFARTSPFLKGEFVQLGLGWNQKVRLWRTSDQKENYIGAGSLPWIAKFVRVLNADAYEVEFPRVADGSTRRYEVLRHFVNRLPVGRAQILRSILAHLDQPVLFSVGETVRYRDHEGLMQIGLIVARESLMTQIARGDRVERVSNADIFKTWTSGEPHSITFDAALLKNNLPYSIALEAPRGFLRDVLNAAARLAAQPEFQAASFKNKLELLMDFQNIVLPYTFAGDTLEATGIQTYSEMLCAGTGICRHNSPLMTAIFSEAGLASWIVHRIAEPHELENSEDSYRAHAWTEVASPTGDMFVVDPSNKIVKRLIEAEQIGAQDAKSLDAEWWAHPARERLSPEHASVKPRFPAVKIPCSQTPAQAR